MKKKIVIILLTVALTLSLAATASATTGAKMIEATYRGIIIMTNGNVVTPEPGMGEPFIVTSEGRTYVPIRLAAEAMGLNVEWVDWLNAVKITGSTSALELEAELEALKAENAKLKAQLEAYQNKEEDPDLRDLEDDLLSDFDELRDVEIEDIILDGDEGDVDVEIEVDLDDFDDEWEELTDRNIEGWIEDLVGDIQDELSKNTYVSGKIIDIDSDDVLVKFNKNGKSKLRVTFYDDDYRGGGSDAADVEDDIEGSSYDVSGLDFTVTDVSYDEDDEEVSARLTADDDVLDDWDDLDFARDIKADVIDIGEDIADTFDAEGFDVTTVYIDFRNDDNKRLDSYNYDVDRGRLS
ncbi:MAG: stalk domain-containing protein [Desulfotomaculaceae bacterium]|nr:stalk domain-containing protein [Desulfotomaculaceae bacterium]MDD4766902.1 stalk domain-containing protein [Desulfotomaculaceae bacterium]